MRGMALHFIKSGLLSRREGELGTVFLVSPHMAGLEA